MKNALSSVIASNFKFSLIFSTFSIYFLPPANLGVLNLLNAKLKYLADNFANFLMLVQFIKRHSIIDERGEWKDEKNKSG